MRSNAGMATRRRDVDLRLAQVSALRTLAWLCCVMLFAFSTCTDVSRCYVMLTLPVLLVLPTCQSSDASVF